MSEPTVDAKPGKNEFLLRRIHSLLGIAPVGVFLIMHLGTNAMIAASVGDKDYFQEQVNRIHALGPLLIPVEILFIFLPLAFHAGLGVKIWLESKPNTSHYPYWANFRYTLQRVTGGIALIFILVHLYHMHWLGAWIPGGAKFDPENASSTAAYALQMDKSWAWPLYVIGILSAVYHFANGIWTSLITWGITIGRDAQRKAGYVCAVFGIALAATGLIAMRGFMTFPDPQAPDKHMQSDVIRAAAPAGEAAAPSE